MDEGLKGAVLSAFYWGYAASQVPGGWAAQRYGGERVLSWSFAAWSLGCLATPGSAASPRAMAAARVGVGLAQVRGGAEAGLGLPGAFCSSRRTCPLAFCAPLCCPPTPSLAHPCVPLRRAL